MTHSNPSSTRSMEALSLMHSNPSSTEPIEVLSLTHHKPRAWLTEACSKTHRKSQARPIEVCSTTHRKYRAKQSRHKRYQRPTQTPTTTKNNQDMWRKTFGGSSGKKRSLERRRNSENNARGNDFLFRVGPMLKRRGRVYKVPFFVAPPPTVRHIGRLEMPRPKSGWC
jgi:hypothetical protein